jgi:hypothetical protein
MKRFSARGVGSALVVVACVATLPPLVDLPSAGIDPSWELGLHLARERGLVVGRDIVFNYGPWGYLNFPLTLVRSQWLASAAHRIAVHLALFLAVCLWMRRHLAGWRPLLPVVPLVLFVPGLEYQWPLALVLWLRLASGTDRERPGAGLLLGAVGAAAVMIKFSMGLAAAVVIVCGAGAAWILGRRRFALALTLGFVAGGVLWGWLALGAPGHVATFLSASWEISSGYVLALERRGPLWQPVLALAACLLLVEGVLRDRRNQPRELLALALPLSGLLLISFKHAFVRHETHAFIAFTVGSAALTWMWLETANRGASWSRLLRWCGPVALFVGSLVVIPPTHLARLPRTAPTRVGQFVGTLRETRGSDYRERLRADLRGQLPLPDGLRELIGNRTVDVMTIEVALIEAWQLNWQPRRVLQSYAVATSALDDLDAAFFSSARAPERLIVDLQGIDTRHPFMDGPRTWRQILSRYEPLGGDRRWLVLGLRDEPRRALETPLVQAQLELNRAALIPRPATGHLELRVRLEPSWLGRLVAVPWKLPEIRLALMSPGDRPAPRRILAGTASRPFPLTRAWPDSSDQLRRVFDEDDLPSPAGLALLTNGSWAWKNAEVGFYQVDWGEGSTGGIPANLAASR